MAERVLDHLEKRRAKADRKAEKQANTVKKAGRRAASRPQEIPGTSKVAHGKRFRWPGR